MTKETSAVASSGSEKPVVLIFIQWYLPGFKAGGPVKSVKSLIEHFSDEFNFKIVTYDRDAGDDRPYKGIKTWQWTNVGEAEVYYIPKNGRKWFTMATLVRNTKADLLYHQSLFAPLFTLLPVLMHRLRLTKTRNCLISPRGQLSTGALSIHPIRKKIFLAVTRLTGFFNKCRWHATSEIEAQEIRQHLRINETNFSRISVATNLIPKVTPNVDSNGHGSRINDSPKDGLRVVFLSRISPKKNLEGALRILGNCRSRIHFSIFGPTEEGRYPGYWQQCQQLISALPSNVTATYEGPVGPESVGDIFRTHDLFLFPTKGENFGHVIAESLLNGCPVMISDQTPWQQLQSTGAGWDLSLADLKGFSIQIDEFADWPKEKFDEARRLASEYAIKRCNSSQELERNRIMLTSNCREFASH